MRYRLTGPGDWKVGFTERSGGAGGMPLRFGRYFSPGEVPYSGEFRLSGLGQTDDSGMTDSSTTSTPSWLQNLVTGITQYKVNQQQLDAISQVNQINIQRAAAGLPPIPVPTLGAPGVNIGLSSDVQSLLLYGGLGIAALWIFSTFMRRR